MISLRNVDFASSGLGCVFIAYVRRKCVERVILNGRRNVSSIWNYSGMKGDLMFLDLCVRTA